MNQNAWYLEHLTDGEGGHQLGFSVDLDPEDLEGEPPTVANWLGVLIKIAIFVHNNEVELEDEEIEVE